MPNDEHLPVGQPPNIEVAKTGSSRSSAWVSLRRFTPARVALGRAGGSLPTAALLDFRLAHARAKDALLHPLDEAKLVRALEESSGLPILRLQSAAQNFDEYLLRPDSGRVLSGESICLIQSNTANTQPDLVLIVSEGLSAVAVEKHAANVIHELLPLLRAEAWQIGPICLVRRARVALQDHLGELLHARLALILIGERPGLISPDSLGAYLVYAPRRGNTDAQRNCVSNISAHGLNAYQAAAKLHWLLTEARRRRVSGIGLKDECVAGIKLASLGGSNGWLTKP
jgi:ethanolamine ammonia-lyase small subunit